jgi:hypothetical protein
MYPFAFSVHKVSSSLALLFPPKSYSLGNPVFPLSWTRMAAFILAFI